MTTRTECECDNFGMHGIDGCGTRTSGRLCSKCNSRCHERITQRLIAACACGWKEGPFDKAIKATNAWKRHARGEV